MCGFAPLRQPRAARRRTPESLPRERQKERMSVRGMPSVRRLSLLLLLSASWNGGLLAQLTPHPSHAKAGVSYLGTEVCSNCHPQQADTQPSTPMARAMVKALYESRVSFYRRLNGLDITIGAPTSLPHSLESAIGQELSPFQGRGLTGPLLPYPTRQAWASEPDASAWGLNRKPSLSTTKLTHGVP